MRILPLAVLVFSFSLIALPLNLQAVDPPLPVPAVAPIRLPTADSDPGGVRLTQDQLFVIDSDVPLFVFGSPTGLVKVTTESGPIKIKGLFAGGPPFSQTKTFAGKYVYTVESADRTGRCELIVVPAGIKAESEAIRRIIDVGAGPVLPPSALLPPPKAVPPVLPPSTGPARLIVLVVGETGKTASEAIEAVLADKTVAARMVEKEHRYRTTGKADKDEDLVRFIAMADGQPLPQVFLVDEAGRVREQAKLSTAEALLGLIKKAGG